MSKEGVDHLVRICEKKQPAAFSQKSEQVPLAIVSVLKLVAYDQRPAAAYERQQALTCEYPDRCRYQMIVAEASSIAAKKTHSCF